MVRRIVIAPLAALLLFIAPASQDVAADVSVARGGTWTIVCRAPCTFDATPGDEVHVALDGLIEEPLVFVVAVAADGRREQDIEVRRRGKGFFAAEERGSHKAYKVRLLCEGVEGAEPWSLRGACGCSHPVGRPPLRHTASRLRKRPLAGSVGSGRVGHGGPQGRADQQRQLADVGQKYDGC